MYLSCKPWPRSCLQVYTGDGKGKTTAAFGLAVRAAGRGLKVYIGQFMKKTVYGELGGAKMLGDLVQVEQYGSTECIPFRESPAEEDLRLAKEGLARARQILQSKTFPIVILDEINIATHFKLIVEAELYELVDSRPDSVELICTGRYAPAGLIERADLVTEMRVIKHPFEDSGLMARDGIER